MEPEGTKNSELRILYETQPELYDDQLLRKLLMNPLKIVYNFDVGYM
jgi:hypothetical protein